MPKYENRLSPYSVHSTVNLPAWRPKDTNVTLMSFSVYLLSFFSKLHDKCCQN